MCMCNFINLFYKISFLVVAASRSNGAKNNPGLYNDI